jgi:glycine dehydrogenase
MKTDSFALRHIGTNENDLPKMLKTIGVESIDQLIYETIPNDILLKNNLD